MPPRDESAAYALDDAILFSRILSKHRYDPLPVSFKAYEDLRRGTVTAAFQVSRRMWEKNRDLGFLECRLKEWTMPMQVRNAKDTREAAWEFDATKVPLPGPGDSTSSLYSSEREFL